MPNGGLTHRHGVLIGLFQQVLDIVIIWLTLLAATRMIGIGWQDIFSAAVLLASLLFWMLAKQNGLYGSWRTQSLTAEVRQVVAT